MSIHIPRPRYYTVFTLYLSRYWILWRKLWNKVIHLCFPSCFHVGTDWWKKIRKMGSKITIDPALSYSLWFALFSSLWFALFPTLASFLSVIIYRSQLRFQTRVIDGFSRFTSACHVRPFSSFSRWRCSLQSSHRVSMQTYGNEVTRFRALSLLFYSFWSERLHLRKIKRTKGETNRIIRLII